MKRAVEDIASYRKIGNAADRVLFVVTNGRRFTATGVEDVRDSDAYMLHSEPGVIRWVSSDNCVPLDICENMDWYDMDNQRAANDADLTKFIAQYKRSQAEFDARTDPEAEAIRAEQAFERRAAFGPGEEVVDIITGKRYTT